MIYLRETADKYIRQNLNNGSKDFKPKYHFSAQVGWINDPNGLIYYDGYFHVFYQYYPYSLQWGPMHWGHARSKNLIDFEYLPVALAPDAPFESGCFSGGAVLDKDNKEIHVLYTRNYEDDKTVRQTQYHAYSADGVSFTKVERAAIGEEQLPPGFRVSSFRDPNPVRIGDRYYVVVGAQKESKTGAVLVYSSKDMSEFEYEFAIENENFGEMVECPDLFMLGGRAVLTLSVIALKSDRLTNIDGKANLYAVMDIDFENKAYSFRHIDSLDEGTDFYAPQSVEDGNGRRIMLAWLDMWNNNPFPLRNKFVSNGVYTLPRELSLNGDTLLQYPLREAKEIFRTPFDVKKGCSMPKTSYAALEMEEGSVFSFGFAGEGFTLRVTDGYFFVEQKQKNHISAVRRGKARAETFNAEVFSDNCSVEIFAGGRDVFSAQAFIECDRYVISQAEKLKVRRAAYI